MESNYSLFRELFYYIHTGNFSFIKIAGIFTVMTILSIQQVYHMVEREKRNTVS